MSSTTEESDWNMSPKARRPHSLSNPDTGYASPTRDVESSSAPGVNGSETFAQVETQLADDLVERGEFIHPHPTNPEIQNPAPNNATSLVQDTPAWEAARDAVLSRMVTSQDLDAAPMPTPTINLKRGGIKTGGRRGRGGRRPKVKIEGDVGVTVEMAVAAGVKVDSTPTRGKNKGGRPRGSRAGVSSRGGITRPAIVDPTDSTPKPKNKGGRPRGSKTVNRGGRPRGSRAGSRAAGLLGHMAKKKRKRSSDEDEDEDEGDTDASEEFTPLAITSSGRRINPTQTYSPVILEPSTSGQIINQNTPTSAPPTIATQKPKKRRKPGDAAVCINCGRGHSPNSNQIVFCDGCNTPWHQFCHDRPITPTVIQFEEKEWICSDCALMRAEKSHIANKVRADKMTLPEKRAYLQSLDKSELVSLLLHASTLHPDLPIFRPAPAAPIPVIVEPQPTRPGHPPPPLPLEDEEYYEVYIEPEPLPYPKPGNGIVLPPEDEDLNLLIDEDIVTYSHLWRGLHGWEGPRGMPWLSGDNSHGTGGPPIGVGA